MKSGVRIAVIGAGSATFSLGLVTDLCLEPGLHGSEVVLMDVDEARLASIKTLAERYAAEMAADIRFTSTTDRRTALSGADFAINTAQAGGHSWVEAQRAMAEQHGFNRGAGLHAIGQMVFMLDVARDVERVCPKALLIQSSNPVFEGCTAMHRETGAWVLGLCHGHLGVRDIADALGLEFDQVSARMPGFNHWIWMTEFKYRGQDAYPLLNAWIDEHAEEFWQDNPKGFSDMQLSKGAIHQYRRYGLMPIGDTPRMVGWWYHTDLETKKEWFGKLGGFDSEVGWSAYLDTLEEAVSRIGAAARDEASSLVETFPPEQTDEQIVPIINSIVNDKEATYQVNIPNRGPLLAGFPEDLVVECQGVVNSSGIFGVVVPPLPRRLVAGPMIERWHRAEMVVEAVRQKDRDLLLDYLLHDHRCSSLDRAEALLTRWFADPRNHEVAEHFRSSTSG